MKYALWLVARLYPVAWRKRYGIEFDALLEEVAPNIRTLLNVLGGAFKMQLTTWNDVKLVAALGVAGIIVAACVSLAAPRQYQSTAILDITGTTSNSAATELINRLQQRFLSRSSLTKLIVQEGLYPAERTRMPLEDVIERLRRSIQVAAPRGESTPIFKITVVSDSPEHAQVVAQTLISSFMDDFTKQNIGQGNRAVLQLLGPASKPQSPVNPRYGPIVMWGGAAGLVVGLAIALVRRQPRLSRTAAAFGAAGALLAFAASWLMTERYVSTAVLHLTGPSATGDARDIVNKLTQPALSRDSLANIIQDFGLYKRELASMPIEDVIRDMRTRDIQVTNSVGGTTFSVAVTTRGSALAALRATQVLAARMIHESEQTGIAVEILDPANFPQTPVSPNRASITVLGLGTGLLLGASAAIFRKGLLPVKSH
jgi:capsular polysaccharide biosynthesis protein